jgi:formylmethanofuran dehydrogenase subunit E
MSSYRPDEMGPSDLADIASWSEPDPAECELCGEEIPQEDMSVEAFEETGFLVCAHCLEHHAETEITQ